MKKPHLIELPDLSDYKQDFVRQGVTIPLTTVPFSKIGLLAELPPPPSGKTGWPWTLETQPSAATRSNGLAWPKVSIVTPSYNQGAYIEETLRSVLLQNYPNLEYIVIDGGSNDETKEILEKYTPWLSFCQSKKDRGQGHAINLGFSLASGNYYGWINSDDLYLSSCFKEVVNIFIKTKKEFIYGDAIEFNEEQGNKNYWQGYIVLDRYLVLGGIIASHSAFWKSHVHAPIWETINCAIDYELWMRMLPNKSKIHIKNPLGLCRIQPESKSSNNSYKSFWQEDYKKIFEVYNIEFNKIKWLTREMMLLHRVYKYINRNNRKKKSYESLIL